MALSEQEIKQLTDEIVRKLSGIRPRMDDPADGRAAVKPEENGWLWDTADQAVRAAKAAQAQLAALTLEKRGELISAMRKTAVENAEHLARMAHEETGYGHVKHKVEKNLLVARRTPGIEDLVTIAHTGDQG